jgi:hypothetical protein
MFLWWDSVHTWWVYWSWHASVGGLSLVGETDQLSTHALWRVPPPWICSRISRTKYVVHPRVPVTNALRPEVELQKSGKFEFSKLRLLVLIRHKGFEVPKTIWSYITLLHSMQTRSHMHQWETPACLRVSRDYDVIYANQGKIRCFWKKNFEKTQRL